MDIASIDFEKLVFLLKDQLKRKFILKEHLITELKTVGIDDNDSFNKVVDILN
jgi:hypothetical protein